MPDEPGEGRGVFSIGAVSRMLDIPVATIRNWEERYGTIVPERTRGGHRVYSRDQVEQLRLVSEHMRAGLSAADAHRLQAEGGEAHDRPAPERTAAGARLHVLVAERDPVGADLERFFLRREGYDVSVTLTAADAEEHWLETWPDLVIVELMISGGAGAQLCRRLKRRAPMPVLAVSVLEARDEALAAGADGFLRKPFEPVELVSAVSDLLGGSAPTARRAKEAH